MMNRKRKQTHWCGARKTEGCSIALPIDIPFCARHMPLKVILGGRKEPRR